MILYNRVQKTPGVRGKDDLYNMTEKREWNRQFNGIGLKLEPQVVRVANDFVLDVYLQADPKNCMRLAKYICCTYKQKYMEELRISERSLAIEIYGHYKMQKAAEKLQNATGPKKLTDWLIGHTTVIDCGSAEKDNNRIIWDTLCKMNDLERKSGLVRLRRKDGER